MEATKFTEVGYVGRDVDSIVRDLVEVSLTMVRDASRRDVQAKAEQAAEDRLVDALVGATASADTKGKFRRMLRAGDMEDKDVEVALTEAPGTVVGQIDLPGVPQGQMINLGEMMRGMMGNRQQQRKLKVAAARPLLERDEADRLVDNDSWPRMRWTTPKTTASYSWMKSTRCARAAAKAGFAAAMSAARACSAICCR